MAFSLEKIIQTHGPLFNYQVRYDEELNEDDGEWITNVENAIKQDNRDIFVQLVNSVPCDELEDNLDLILQFMLSADASKCLAAVLAEETNIFNVNAWLSAEGSSPLHKAASSTSCRITALLLETGFSADERCNYQFLSLDESYSLGEILPLGVVLEELGRQSFKWNFKGSISAVKLVVELFSVSNEHLETLRLLAENSRELKREFLNYLKEGEIDKVGALLLVARSRLLSLSTTKGEFRSISEMYDFVLDAKRRLFADPSRTETNKLIKMEETLVLLRIFDRIGDKLATLLRIRSMATVSTSFAAASLLKYVGFDAKEEPFYLNNNRYQSFLVDVLDRGIDDCEKTASTTLALPSWLKEPAFNDKSGTNSRPTYPFLAEAPPEIDHVSVLASLMSENKPPRQLQKQGVPFFDALERVYVRGNYFQHFSGRPTSPIAKPIQKPACFGSQARPYSPRAYQSRNSLQHTIVNPLSRHFAYSTKKFVVIFRCL